MASKFQAEKEDSRVSLVIPKYPSNTQQLKAMVKRGPA
jgi:hypothetical protein